MGYSLEEIRAARAYIKKVAIEELFSKKGGANFISLSGKDIERLFELYDDIFFQKQITEKVGKNQIKFYASERTSGAGGVCSMEQEKQGCIYYLDIAPNILNTIFKSGKGSPDSPLGLQDAAGIGCEDRTECLLLILEHQIIHLLMLLWDYFPLEGTTDVIYGPHGSLFQCMIREYFGHTQVSHDLGISSINIISDEDKQPSPPRGIAPFGYAYWSNSCYLDSLMTVLLENISSFWRVGLMETTVEKIVYRKGVCDVVGGSQIYTYSDLREHAQKVQDQIRSDFQSLHPPILTEKTPSKIICSRLRTLLAECLPRMKIRGSWVTFNASAIYDILAGMFPSLLMDVPIQIHRWSVVKRTWLPDPVKYQKLAMFAMWDYLDPLTNVGRGDDYKEIRWDLLQAQGIVFYNGGTPRIKNFGEKGPEAGMNIIRGARHKFNVNKIRSFGKTIIDGRYRLVGVVSLLGVAASGEGGSHYVAHFLGNNGKWYYYNDMSSKIVQIEDLPQIGVWKEEKGVMPSLYFYQKLKDLASPEKSSPTRKGTEIHYKGSNLDYRRVTAGVQISFFVYDKTVGYKMMNKLTILKPTTVIDDHTLFWKVPIKNAATFELALKELDNTTTFAVKKHTGIDSVEYGDLYKHYPAKQVKIYNYSDRLVGIVGGGSKAVVDEIGDGLEINLKYGLGQGYIIPKKKLEEMEYLLGRR